MSDRQCLEGDRMVTCPVAGLEALLDGAHVWRFDDYAQRLPLVERVRVLAAQRDRLRERRNAAEAEADRLTRQREALKAAARRVNQCLDAEMYQHCSTQVRAETAERQVGNLRQDLRDAHEENQRLLEVLDDIARERNGLRAALEPFAVLDAALSPSREDAEETAVEVTIGNVRRARAALAGEAPAATDAARLCICHHPESEHAGCLHQEPNGHFCDCDMFIAATLEVGAEPEDVCSCFHDRRFHHWEGNGSWQCSVDGCDCLVFNAAAPSKEVPGHE